MRSAHPEKCGACDIAAPPRQAVGWPGGGQQALETIRQKFPVQNWCDRSVGDRVAPKEREVAQVLFNGLGFLWARSLRGLPARAEERAANAKHEE